MNIINFALINPKISVPIVFVVLFLLSSFIFWGNNLLKKVTIIFLSVAAVLNSFVLLMALLVGIEFNKWGVFYILLFLVPLVLLVCSVAIAIYQFRNLPQSRLLFLLIWVALTGGIWVVLKVVGDWEQLWQAVLTGNPKELIDFWR